MPRCLAVLVTAAVVSLAACGEPEYPSEIPCSEADTCPPGQVCDPFDHVCRYTPIPVECRQDSECASGDCDEGTGTCVDACRPETCAAGPCERTRCEGDTCVVEPLCEDGETCCGGACVAAGCDDGNPCTADSCGEQGCEHTPASGGACDDGVHCNGADTCMDGACTGHAGDPCTSPAVCEEGMDACVGCLDDSDCPAAEVGEWSECDFSGVCVASGTATRSVTSYTCQNSVCVSQTATESQACERNTDGVACGTIEYGPWGSCAGFDDVCDASGTQSREVTTHACANEVCTPATTTEEQACGRVTEGVSCDDPVIGPWGACEFEGNATCDESGTRTRDVTTFACASEACTAATLEESESCARDTDELTCAPTEHGAWSDCDGYSGTCDETGTRTRIVTTHACADGSCESTIGTETEACERDTDGASCGTVTCSAWSDCGGYANSCDETGTRTRQCTSPICAGGTCSVTSYTETQSCTRQTDEQPCGNPSCGSWSQCGGYAGTCDETGTRSRTCTTPLCSNGTCSGSRSESQTQACSRDTDGDECGGTTCGSWGPCISDGLECGPGTRARTCQVEVCESASCNGSETITQTQSCSVGCPFGQSCFGGMCCTSPWTCGEIP